MSSTKPVGVRLSVELYNFVRAANPNLNFSQIVIRALEKEYSYTDSKNNTNIQDVHLEIDRIIGNVNIEE